MCKTLRLVPMANKKREVFGDKMEVDIKEGKYVGESGCPKRLARQLYNRPYSLTVTCWDCEVDGQ